MYYLQENDKSEQMKVGDLIDYLSDLDEDMPIKTALIDHDAKNASIASISHIAETKSLDPDEEEGYVIIPIFL